jgi:hypothetical protein
MSKQHEHFWCLLFRIRRKQGLVNKKRQCFLRPLGLPEETRVIELLFASSAGRERACAGKRVVFLSVNKLLGLYAPTAG